MNKIEISSRLIEQGYITQEEFNLLTSNDNRLKDFQIWKEWKYNETILLDSKLIETLKNN